MREKYAEFDNIDSPLLLQEVVEELSEEGSYKEALVACNMFVRNYPEDVYGFMVRQNLYTDLGKYRKALGDLKKIIDFGHGDPGVYLLKGRYEAYLGMHAEALNDLKVVNNLTNKYQTDVLYHQGVVYYALGDYESAMSSLESIIKFGHFEYEPLRLLTHIATQKGDKRRVDFCCENLEILRQGLEVDAKEEARKRYGNAVNEMDFDFRNGDVMSNGIN